jgi:hypothetical protein
LSLTFGLCHFENAISPGHALLYPTSHLADTMVPHAFLHAKGPLTLALSCFQVSHLTGDCLLNMDHLATGIQDAMHPNFLAFVLFHYVLVIDVVSGVARGILKHILVP